MEIKKVLNQIGTVRRESGAVKNYRKNPGDFTTAAIAALYYAERNNQDMILVPGSSYGHKVFHIAKMTDSLKKYTVSSKEAAVAIVKLDGSVFQAVAN